MPDIGRTTTLDPHAENYYAFSPYSMFANNPLIFTDPTGMDLNIDKDENFGFKAKAFTTLAVGWLTSSTQRAQINQLISSSNTHTIKSTTIWNRAVPMTSDNYLSERPNPPVWEMDFKTGSLGPNPAAEAAYQKNYAEWEEGKKDNMPHKDGTGDGSTIYLNLSKSSKGEGENFVVNAGHEFRHATEIDRGTLNTDRIRGIYQVQTGVDMNGNPIMGDAYPGKHERNAIAAQNRIATESNRFRRRSKRAKLMKNYYQQVP